MKEWASFIALLGVILGAGITHLSSSSLDFEQRSLKFRLDTYREFAHAQVAWQKAQDMESKEEANKKIKNSTVQIALFGPKEIAVDFSEWLEVTRKCIRCDLDPTELSIYHAMRSEASRGSLEILSDTEMAYLIYGCNLNFDSEQNCNEAKLNLSPNP